MESHPRSTEDLQALLYSGNYGVAHASDTVVGGLIKHYSEGKTNFGLWPEGTWAFTVVLDHTTFIQFTSFDSSARCTTEVDPIVRQPEPSSKVQPGRFLSRPRSRPARRS